MRILFMGTPEFAVPSLEALMENNEIIGIFTKIDKPNTRGGKIKYNPVKEFALANNIPIFQPESFKDPETIKIIKDMEPDLIVVVAYGKIIPKQVIDIPKKGIINVHSSILPKYRGAAPINAALIAGEKETGVSIMYIGEGLDTGDIITVEKTPITDEDNFLSLHDRLKVLGAKALIRSVEHIDSNNVKRIKQDDNKATFVKPFHKEDLKIDWNMSERQLFNFIRGLDPFPGAYTTHNNKIIKIYKVCENHKDYPNVENGTVVDIIKKKGPVVKVKDGSVILLQCKPEGKKNLTGVDMLNGGLLKKDDILL